VVVAVVVVVVVVAVVLVVVALRSNARTYPSISLRSNSAQAAAERRTSPPKSLQDHHIDADGASPYHPMACVQLR
jgi:hypothetical protein